MTKRWAAAGLAGVLTLAASLMAPAADAAGAANLAALGNPGVLPTNPFYFVVEGFHWLELTLTFSSTGKAELLMSFARSEAAQAVVLAKQGEAADARQALRQYQQDVREATHLLGQKPSPDLLAGLTSTVDSGHVLLQDLRQENAPASVIQSGEQTTTDVTDLVVNQATNPQTGLGQVEGIVAEPVSLPTSTTSGTGSSSGTSTAPPTISLVGGSQYPLAPNAVVVADDQAPMAGQVVNLYPGMRVHLVLLNGAAILVRLQGFQSTVTYEGQSSGTISLAYDGVTFSAPLAADAELYGPGGPSPVAGSSTLQAGMVVRVRYDAFGAVTAVVLRDGSDHPNQNSGDHQATVSGGDQGGAVPSGSVSSDSATQQDQADSSSTSEDQSPDQPLTKVEGVITAVSADSLTVNGTVYVIPPTATIRGGDTPVTLSEIQPGVRAKLWLNASGTVVALKLERPDNVTGTLQAIGSTGITVNGVTYPLLPGYQITGAGDGQTPPLTAGMTVKLKFTVTGWVWKVHVVAPSADNSGDGSASSTSSSSSSSDGSGAPSSSSDN